MSFKQPENYDIICVLGCGLAMPAAYLIGAS